jgi:hypothetical protein
MFRFDRRAVLAAGAVLLVAGGTLGYAEFRNSSARADGIDYSQDEAANYAASQLGQALLRDLPKLAGYAGLQIVRYGIEVDTVGPPDPRLCAAVTRAVQRYRYQGGEIEVRYRLVRYTERELEAVVTQLGADAKELAGQGIELSTWGPDIDTNKVEISLVHYSKAYRDILVSRYGDRVTVTPYDVVVVPN